MLVPVFVSYLLFREPPPGARVMIRAISRISLVLQKVRWIGQALVLTRRCSLWGNTPPASVVEWNPKRGI